MSSGSGTKAVVAALLANTGIAITKFIAFLLTGFSAMLAESIHSAADSANQLLLLVGGKRSQRDATEEHPFGYGRERYIYAFVVAVVLFSVGGLFTLYESIHKLMNLDHVEMESHGWQQYVPVAVLGVAIVLESLSFRTAIVEGRKSKGAHTWPQFIRNAKAPELPVILLEDFAALMGLVFALVAVVLTLVTHDPVYDILGSALIGVLLILVAVILTVEVKSLLVGEAASKESITRIRAALESAPGLDGVVHLKTLHIAPEELLVAAKVAVRPGALAEDIAQAIDDAEAAMRAVEPMATQIFLEPDIRR
ncbi:MAG TPA: cation diffusion facilitator family transporter [Aeromicrobium sp.]|nr:cation diffusion facilitator family transporter [Aeromicrobium sp.]